MNALSLILDTFAPVAGRSVLDIGCGPGTLAATLAERGAIVTGVDPNPEAVATAQRATPAATFMVASADALPIANASQDGAVLLNALHHVPSPAAALREAGRALRPGRPLVVIEPLAEGSFFEALRPIEDETAVRAAAQAAIAAAIDASVLRCDREERFDRLERFADLDAFLARVAAVDPARLAAIAAQRSAVAEILRRVADRDADGSVLLRQPLRAHVLRSPRSGAV